jgi:hypothetical protein
MYESLKIKILLLRMDNGSVNVEIKLLSKNFCSAVFFLTETKGRWIILFYFSFTNLHFEVFLSLCMVFLTSLCIGTFILFQMNWCLFLYILNTFICINTCSKVCLQVFTVLDGLYRHLFLLVTVQIQNVYLIVKRNVYPFKLSRHIQFSIRNVLNIHFVYCMNGMEGTERENW